MLICGGMGMLDDVRLGEAEERAEAESLAGIAETPTYFGPSESPLFGFVHAPSDGRVRGGVIICGSLGKDHADNLRGLRVFADRLAQKRILALRFDYLGCGDSAYGQLRDTAVGDWQASIGHAIDYLRSAGIDDLSAVGVRAGCLILHQALVSGAPVSRVAYWDPVSTGRRYLREQTAFFKMSAGEDDVPPGVVSTIGARFSAPAAAELSALKLSPFPDSLDRFIVGRTGSADQQLTSLIGDGRTESVAIEGLEDCAQPTQLLTQTSWQAIDLIVDWLDRQLPAALTTARPAYSSSAWIPGENGASVFERIERIAPQGLFAIRTLPADDGDTLVQRPTVAFFSHGLAPHQGPNREWVELSRAVAAAGGSALRWDRRMVGESGTARAGEEIRIYSPEGIQDALAVTRHARQGARRLQLVGMCSGAWFAALSALESGSDSVVLANQLQWSRRVKKSLRLPVQPGDDDGQDWEQTPRARTRRVLQRFLPATAWSGLGLTGAVQAPSLTLGPLARRGLPTTVILCSRDLQLFRANRGDVALRRLKRSAAPPTLVASNGDHAGFHQGVYIPLRAAVLTFITRDAD